MVEPHSLFAHILAQTRKNVELLVAHKQISETDGKVILSRLSANAEKHPKPRETSVVALTQKTQHLSMSPAPPKVEARAIWEWSSEDPNDLSFREGDVVEIISETNADWWTGRNRLGKQGLFPSNYVEKLPSPSSPPILVREPHKSISQSTGYVEQQHPSPALPHPSPLTSPQPYAAAPHNPYQPLPGYYPPPGGPPPGAVGYSYGPPAGTPAPHLMPQETPAKKNKFGALGQTMLQSAASGAGFGVGAAIGSDIVNSIF